ncbi:protein ASPARTIC PROTEASE IN GUARD CELL 1-like [Papaver somniferum]|nr:protein ASPARTIC PROTEASE IN GUARD CELL 1-like [Papaver somniferum]
MEELRRFCMSFLLFTLLYISPSFVHSRSLVVETHKKTTLLDITASIQKTIDVVSASKPETTIQNTFLQQETTFSEFSSSSSSSSSKSFTLELHSRDSLHSSSHKDYKTLIKSRLERDSARVRSLNTKLDLAVNGIKKSDFKPVETTLEQSLMTEEGGKSKTELEGPIISGTSQGSGEYFSRVGIGRPPKPLYMVLDTGSDVTWVQCSPCTDCYQQTDPIFEPSSSSSYSQIMCNTDTCQALDVSACRAGVCLYQVSYGDGSYTVGDFVSETLTFGNSSSVNNVSLGCGHDNEGLFVGSAGLLGLGGGSLSFPSQLKTESFSYCLVDRDSSSTSTLDFGSSSELNVNNSVTTPLLRNNQLDTYYYLGLTGLSVGGEMLTIPPSAFEVDESGNGGIIIDSGTAVTRLKTDVYNSLRDAFVEGTQNLPTTSGVAIFDTCYDLSTMRSVDVPTISLHFPGDKYIALPAKNYLVPVDSAGTFCLAFAPTSSSLSIIGNIQQQGTRVTFDLVNSLVGFSASQC